MKKNLLNKKKQKAISIIEVLIAILITVISLAGIAKLYFMLNSNVNFLNSELVAANMAGTKLEEFRNYHTISGTTNSYDSITSNTSSPETTTVNNITYTTTWTVTEYTTPYYKNVKITVSWTGKDNLNKSFTSETIIVRDDPSSSGNLYQDESSGVTVTKP